MIETETICSEFMPHYCGTGEASILKVIFGGLSSFILTPLFVFVWLFLCWLIAKYIFKTE